MANEQWQARVARAQQMAAERLGVDVSVMAPPRQGGAEGTTAPAVEAELEPEVQPVQAEAVAETTPAATAAEPAPTAGSSAAAQRIAEAKARAAAKGSTNGGAASAATTAAPAAAPAGRTAAPAARPAATPEPKVAEAEEVGQPGINRREFLTYAWGAALGLLTLETGVATYAFMYPRFRAGEFGGKFQIGPVASLPAADDAPMGNTTGKFWLVDTEAGPKALYMVCTHLGCLYKWEPSNFRFECPCHGSKFTHDGYYIEGPAPRSLDQFVIEIVQNGAVVSQTTDDGTEIVPPEVPGPDAEIVIDTGSRIVGKPATASQARADS